MKQRYFLLLSVLVSFICGFVCSQTHAEDLLYIYELAQINDPTIQAAKEAQLAAREALPQARAQFLPVLSASANHGSSDTQYANSQVIDNPLTFPEDIHYNQSIFGLSLTQPVFYYQQWVQLAKAHEQVKQANAKYAAAEQDLIVRTTRGYFEVLKAIDALKFAKAAHLAFNHFLGQTEERFKVGLIAITDVQIAKAQRDSAYATVIAAENEVENKKEQLRTITGKKIERYASLRENITLKAPEPANIERWVKQATEQNYNLLAARYQVNAYRTDIKLNSANHLPTLSVGANMSHSTSIPINPRNTNRNIALQVQLPLFSGGSVNSKTRQAVHTYEQVQQEMEALYRQVESNTRQAYLGILTQISQATALKQAVVSNQSALKATDDSFNVGTRTIVDVLNSQSYLIEAEQNYAYARYDYILEGVLLKNAAGMLCPEDVRHINTLLKN